MATALQAVCIYVTLAVQLFKEGNLSLGKAAKLANMLLVEFTEYVSEQNIPIVDFSEAEFEREI